MQVADVRCIRRDITFVGRNFCFYIFQLFEVDRIAVVCTGCHVGDSRVVGIDTCRGDRRTACNGKTGFAKRDVISCIEYFTAYAVQSCERFAQLKFVTYFLVARVLVVSNSQVLVHGSEVRTFDGVGRSLSVFRFFRNGHIVACFDSGLAIFQLGDVHRISICQTRGEVGDLSCFIRRADRDSAVAGFPCRIICCRCFIRSGIVPENTRSGTCYRTGTQSDAAFFADVGVIAEDGDVRFFGFRFRFLRADNDISVHLFQLVVVAHDEVMTRVDNGVSVACNDIVGHSRSAWTILVRLRIGNFVTHAGNLRIESAPY